MLGNNPLGDGAARERAITEFDSNRDRRVQRAELAALLSQNMALGQPFSVQWVADDGNAVPKWQSPLFVLLDDDQDGRLSTTELATAEVRLLSRDVDDNELVGLIDFRGPAPATRDMNYRPEPGPTRAFELRSFTLDSVYYTLCEQFGESRRLGPEAFAVASSLMAALDEDQSGAIEQAEMTGLLTARPDLAVRVRLGKRGEKDAALELVSLSADLEQAGAKTHVRPGQLILELAGCELDISTSDADSQPDMGAAIDQLFTMYDADKNDVLDADEIARLPPPAASGVKVFDADADGKLTRDEAGKGYGKLPIYRNTQVQARVAESGDALFGWLDAQPDGRLTARRCAARRSACWISTRTRMAL